MSFCSDSLSAAVSGGESSSAGEGTGGEIMLFGVRVKVDPMRKIVSMNNLSEYENNTGGNPSCIEIPKAAVEAGGAAGYDSADEVIRRRSNKSGDRKRGVSWTVKEHQLFLLGLEKVGRGNWKRISKKFVKTRTPIQVASHAQKYYNRRSNPNKPRRRRPSLFDITTDSVNATPVEGVLNHQDSSLPQPAPQQTFMQLPVTSNTNQPAPQPTFMQLPVTSNTNQPAPQPTFMQLPITSNTNGFPVMHFPVTVAPVLLSMQGGNPMENLGFARSGDCMNNPSAMFVHQVPVVSIMPTPSAVFDCSLNQQVPPLCLSLSLSPGVEEPLPSSISTFEVIPSSKREMVSY